MTDSVVRPSEDKEAEKKINSLRIEVKPLFFVRILTMVAVAMVLLHLSGVFAFYVGGMDSPFMQSFLTRLDLDGEGNTPAFFSSFILFCSAILFLIIGKLQEERKDRFTSYWKSLSMVFLYLSLDEAFMLHEIINNKLMSTGTFSGAFYFPWVLAGLTFVVFLVVIYMRFFLSLSTMLKLRLFVASVLFLSGALGMEMVGGNYSYMYGEDNLEYSLITTIEESLEISGILFLIWTLVNYLKKEVGEVSLEFTGR